MGTLLCGALLRLEEHSEVRIEGTYSLKVNVISCHLVTGWPLDIPGEGDIVIVKATSWGGW